MFLPIHIDVTGYDDERCGLECAFLDEKHPEARFLEGVEAEFSCCLFNEKLKNSKSVAPFRCSRCCKISKQE